MIVRTMERAAQALQLLACWIAFGVVWWAAAFSYRGLLETRGADLPWPALALYAVARDGWPLLIPAIYTVSVVWLARRGDRHDGWIRAVLLSVAILFLAFAVLGFASPHATMCTSV